jgi:broad specificity phosphatase PhoE
LESLLLADGIEAENITWLSSPFLRCLQTSDGALNAFSKIDHANTIVIQPEYSVFEWDGHGGKWHQDLPSLEERVHYFPRLDLSYESLFVPPLPESKSHFLGRCDKAIKHLHQRFPYKPRSAIVIVTHAAGCIGLARACAQITLEQLTPAGPTSIFGLYRTNHTEVWNIDKFDTGLNGHIQHLSDMGTRTLPWNNFGDKRFNHGYTGPPHSRFAPRVVEPVKMEL